MFWKSQIECTELLQAILWDFLLLRIFFEMGDLKK